VAAGPGRLRAGRRAALADCEGTS